MRSLRSTSLSLTVLAVAALAPWQTGVALQRDEPLPADAVEQTLSDFQRALDERWSYRHANDADFAGAIEALRQRAAAGITVDQLGLELQKIISLGIDGHAAVSGFRLPNERYLPFLVEPVGDRFVAFWPDRSGFVEADSPYLARIDGLTISQWREAAAPLAPQGSPQYVRRNALRALRAIEFLRQLAGVAPSDVVRVELESRDGQRVKTVELPLAERGPVYGTWPQAMSRFMPGGVGYLRLPSMDGGAVAAIRQWMPRFADEAGLVVDVRDNGGGSRDALLELYRWLAAPDDPPRVANAAAYRLHPQHDRDHLAARFMYRADSPHWTPRQRSAIDDFTERFAPQWEPPVEQFSAWHYLVLDAAESDGHARFDKPVVVLMNAKCFSATDIFLAGMASLPQVTLLGTASGGGSARSQTVRLGPTGLRLRIGSMASLQPDGRLFDGHGVAPDVVVEPTPEYFIGGEDRQLQAALELIRSRAAEPAPASDAAPQ